jgi:hypothetical protein
MPKKSAAKATPTKSDVIRSMPKASAGDIIKKAKALGLQLTANHVYAVRAIDKRRGKPRGLGSPRLGLKPNKRGASKTEFIRGFGAETPAAQVVAEAKRAGVKISKEYVYRVRALAKPNLPPGRGLSRGDRGRRTGPADPRSERRLTSLALEIGLLRATLLLDSVRARLDA